MTNSNGKISKRAARVMGLILVLGMPLAVMTPISSDRQDQGAPSSGLASAASPASEATGSAEEVLEVQDPTSPTAPLPDFDSIEIQESDPSNGAAPVTTVVNDPRCGPGFTSTGITGNSAFACIHSVLDPLPPISQPVARAATAAPVCLGNGVNGPRVQLIYMYVEGQPDRTATVVPRIINDIVPRMEGAFRSTSKLQGREIGMRLHMPGCKLTVATVKIDAANGEPDDPGRMLARITRQVAKAGFNTTDRKYVLWFDGGNKGACGVAPYPISALAPHATDNPVVGATSDVGWQQGTLASQGLVREVAISFRWGFPLLGELPPPPFPGAAQPRECWGQGGTGARTELHELIHLLGAVNLAAPNSNGLGHCKDDHDIMCYGEAGVATVPRCATPVEQLDCGSDDYFNVRPAVGSYLSTHWNTANSRFLGNAIVHDAVPIEIPRP